MRWARRSSTLGYVTDVNRTRTDAWALLCEWTHGESLRKHGLAVEGAVAWYAQHRFGIRDQELETWRAAGLLHDFDYERYPDTHPVRGAEELRRLGYPDDLVQAVLGHGVIDPGARQNQAIAAAKRRKQDGNRHERCARSAEHLLHDACGHAV